MKKILTLAVAGAIIASLAACGPNRGEAVPSGNPNAGTAESSSAEKSVAEESATPTMDDLFAAIHDAYGEAYLAGAPMTEDYISAVYGLTSDLYEEVRGEMSMISVHPDEVIVVKAKPGKAGEVEKALTSAMEAKKNDAVQYPMNIPKTGASQVVRHGDYVAYLLLGAPVEDNSLDEAERKAHFEEESKKGAEAIAALFEKP